MKKHLLCLTVDTDPDGLSGRVTNRQTLRWEGLDHLQRLPDDLGATPNLGQIPLTWFVRADGQLESILGTPSYLLERYNTFWLTLKAAGHEIGWHPHLYTQPRPEDAALLITDPQRAQDELERLWNALKSDFHATAFRHGEGWHTPRTYNAVERLGFDCDSTAIPGRGGVDGHPMNWNGAPNQPYFPDREDLCKSGPQRPMLELPMNTWLLQAPHDAAPRVRYMNPAVHPGVFANALKNWENACNVIASDLCVWVMIFHPDEVLASQGADALYSRSVRDLCGNLLSMTESLQRLGHDLQWTTVSEAAARWRIHQRCVIA